VATIINTLLSSDEGKLRIHNPIIYIPDPDKSGPLGLASVYFGLPDRDPLQVENQKRAYAIQEDGTALAITQPVMTSSGGVTVHNGTYAAIAIDGDYSFKVIDSSGSQKYYLPTVKNASLLESGIVSIVEDVITLAGGQTSVIFPNADVSVSAIDIDGIPVLPAGTVDSRGLFKEIDYVIANGGSGEITLTTPYPTGTLIRARQNVSTAQQDTLAGVNRVFSVNTTVLAKSIGFALDDVVKIVGDADVNDGLSSDFIVVPESTGVDDGVNFINLDNLLQLKLIARREKLQTFTESKGTGAILSGVLTFDLNTGTTQEITLTENVTSFVFGNIDTTGRVTTITITFKQDGVGSHGVNFTGIEFAGGTAPTITAAANAKDIIVLTTDDGVNFTGFVSGQNFS
jgi:hypothetical protein